MGELARRLKKSRNAEYERGHIYHLPTYSGDTVPPSLMYVTTTGEKLDPNVDRLIVCVNEGAEYVAFDPWSWKALYMFVDSMTRDKSGDVLAGFQALCRISLIPNATLSTNVQTESGLSQLLAYKTRNGEVEMNRRTNGDGSTTVQVLPRAFRAPRMRQLLANMRLTPLLDRISVQALVRFGP